MSKKKIVIIALISALIISGVLVKSLFISSNSSISKIPAINAIPVNSPIIIEIREFSDLIHELTNKNNIWKELIAIPAFQQLSNSIGVLDSIVGNNDNAAVLLENKPVLISSHLTGKNNIDFLFTIKLSGKSDENRSFSTIKALLKGKATITSRNYEHTKIYKANFTDKIVKTYNIKSFSFTICKGFIISSVTDILVEDAIRQLSAEKVIRNLNGFKQIAHTANADAHANIYVNYKLLPKLLAVFANRKYIQAIKKYINFANWGELDATIKEDAILLNGYTYSDKTLKNYLNIFTNQQPQNTDIESILPDNTSTFITLSIENNKAFLENYKKYMQQTGIIDIYTNDLKQIKTKINIDVEKSFYSFLGSEMAIVFAGTNVDGNKPNSYAIFKTKDKLIAKNELMKILTASAKKLNKHISVLTEVFNINDQDYNIYRMPVKDITKKLFGGIFATTNPKYYTFINDYLIFGSSARSLTEIINANVSQNTLKNDLNYEHFSKSISEKSNYYFYSNTLFSSNLHTEYLSKRINKDIDKNFNTVKKFQAFAIQFSTDTDKDLIYTNVYLQHKSLIKRVKNTAWESRLDTASCFKPQYFTNHYTKEKEIFIQDLRNTIYLINNSGRILWKKQLYEKINSKIHEIDLYKNNKLQLLFSTRNKIHVIDRNGNFVKNYPIKLNSPAITGISVFDYNKTKDYRIFVACMDKKVYAFSKDGKKLEGWAFDKTENLVNKNIQYFKVGKEDFIVFADKLKTYIINRKGETKINLTNSFSHSKNNQFYIDANYKGILSKSRIITTDKSGTVYNIWLNGKIEKTKLQECSLEHYFIYKDIDGNGHKDYIIADNNILTIYGHNHKQLFTRKFNENISFKPSIYTFPKNKVKIGIVLQAENKIFLLDAIGKNQKGFPLNGQSEFTIIFLNNSKEEFNVLVGDEENFLYNYKMNYK